MYIGHILLRRWEVTAAFVSSIDGRDSRTRVSGRSQPLRLSSFRHSFRGTSSSSFENYCKSHKQRSSIYIYLQAIAHFSYFIETTTLYNLYNQTIHTHIYQAFRVFVLHSYWYMKYTRPRKTKI